MLPTVSGDKLSVIRLRGSRASANENAWRESHLAGVPLRLYWSFHGRRVLSRKDHAARRSAAPGATRRHSTVSSYTITITPDDASNASATLRVTLGASGARIKELTVRAGDGEGFAPEE